MARTVNIATVTIVGNSGIVGVGFTIWFELGLGDMVDIGVGESVGTGVVVGLEVGVKEGDGVGDGVIVGVGVGEGAAS